MKIFINYLHLVPLPVSLVLFINYKIVKIPMCNCENVHFDDNTSLRILIEAGNLMPHGLFKDITILKFDQFVWS